MDAVTEVKVFAIHAERVEEFRAAIEKAIRKATRYGSGVITYTIGPMYAEKVRETDWDGETRTVTYYKHDVTVTGDAARVGNYEFLARIEFVEGGVMLDVKPGVEDLDRRFRSTDCHCDHCGVDRARNEVYVVRNLDSGEQVQVGRSCLRDFLGIDTPEKIANRFTFWRELGNMEDEDMGPMGSRGGDSVNTIGALKLAARCIRLFGWCSVSQARDNSSLTPTVEYVALGRRPRETIREKWDLAVWDKIHAPDAADEPVAIAALEWVRNTMRTESDYEHNLATVLAGDSFPAKRTGLAISAVAAYHRAMDIELRRTKERTAALASAYVGKEGERVRDMVVTLDAAISLPATQFGERVLYKFKDDAGNILVWFTSPNDMELAKGERAKLTGTVKRHEEREGVKQTILSRCKLAALAA
jgi:hypothetical protein